jgi:hypothetical protein
MGTAITSTNRRTQRSSSAAWRFAAGGSVQGPDNTGLDVGSVSVSIRAGALQRIFIAAMVGLADPIAIAVRDEVRIKVISLPARRPVQGDIPHLGSPGAAAVGETRRAMYRQQLISGQNRSTLRLSACV